MTWPWYLRRPAIEFVRRPARVTEAGLDAIRSILSGETAEQWRERTGQTPTNDPERTRPMGDS